MKDSKPAAYRVADLAERWSCSTGHIYGMINAGKLQAFKFGSLFRISAEEVRRIEDGRADAIPEQESDMRADIVPRNTAATQEHSQSWRPGRFTEADIRRAIRAVQREGAKMAVEISPDGTIRIVPITAQAVPPNEPNPRDKIKL